MIALNNIEFRRLGFEQIDQIREIWEKNRALHERKSVHFKNFFREMTFEKRKKTLLKDEQTCFRIVLAVDRESGRDIGFCVSTITGEKVGEVDSIYVDDGYRGRKIGKWMISDALTWFKDGGARQVWVSVIHGNEDALGFYMSFGLFPKTYEMTASLEGGGDGDARWNRTGGL